MSDPHKTFVSALENWTGMVIGRAMRDLEGLARQAGLSMPQMSTLMRLHYHQQAYRVSDIGEHLGVTNAAASQMIQRMVESGLLARTEDLNDRRVKQVYLTPTGQQLVEETIQRRRSWMENLAQQLTSSELDQISKMLAQLITTAKHLDHQIPDHRVETHT